MRLTLEKAVHSKNGVRNADAIKLWHGPRRARGTAPCQGRWAQGSGLLGVIAPGAAKGTVRCSGFSL